MTLELGWNSTYFVAVALNDSPPIGESIRKKTVLENIVHERKKRRIK